MLPISSYTVPVALITSVKPRASGEEYNIVDKFVNKTLLSEGLKITV